MELSKMDKPGLLKAAEALAAELDVMRQAANTYRPPLSEELDPAEPISVERMPSRRQAEQALVGLMTKTNELLKILERNLPGHPGHEVVRKTLVAYHDACNRALYPAKAG